MNLMKGMVIIFVSMVIGIFIEILFVYITGEAGVLKNYLVLPILQTLKVPQDNTVKDELPPYPSYIKPTDGEWQTVSHAKDKFYVYSAFLERRKGQRSEVRIIAATKRENPDKVWCRFWYQPTEVDSVIHMSKAIAAEIKVIREHYNLTYSACFVLCPLEENHPIPTSVSVVPQVLYPPTNLLIVNDNYKVLKPINMFGVCIKPLLNNYNQILRILELLELSRILGVSHFTLYNHTIGPQVDCLLKDYISRGIVTLHAWQFEITSLKKIRLGNMFAALNDCIYRSMYRYSYILVIDLDEYIIPRNNYSLDQLIQYLEQQQKSNQELPTGSYTFQNTYFYLGWNDDKRIEDTNDTIAANLFTQKKIKRTINLHPHHIRSKYICKPERVVEVGNHFVWEFIPGYASFNVSPHVALLHHYREYNCGNCLDVESGIDTTAFRYRDFLVNAVKERFSYLKDKCGIDDFQIPKKIKSKF